MFILAHLINAIATVLDMVLVLFYWLILIRVLISWFSPSPFNPLVQFLYRITEPVLYPIRQTLPFGPIDLSPVIAFFLIVFLQKFLVPSLIDLAYSLN